LNRYLTSIIFRKVLASLSGLFLVVFLIGHLIGNFQLFIPGEIGKTQFNKYALFMTTNPIVFILSMITYLSILMHIALTIYLTIISKKARPVKYYNPSVSNTSSWASRNMTILGIIILFFIVIHMKSFWYEMHFGKMPYQILEDGSKIKDLHQITIQAFKNGWYSLFYIFCMLFLGFHLYHGVQSGLQTIGLKTKKYSSSLNNFGLLISILIPSAFALIPLYIYFIG
tara:strand:+ start:113 stop:793 length:681 start_codon:yes stop_codon:yes gene_type:complete